MKQIKTSPFPTEMPSAKDFFESIYESSFLPVARYVSRSGGSLEQAKDIFHDAIIIYYEKCIGGNLKIEQSENAYILGIAKHLWLRTSGKEQNKAAMDYSEVRYIPPDPVANEKKLLQFVEQTGQRCLQLLRSFYFENTNMKKIAVDFGFNSDRSATVQKYKCIEKIRKVIKQKSLTYEDFFE